MTWLRFTDNVTERPAWEGLGTDAFMLHVAALGYSNRQLTEGRLSASVVQRLLWIASPLVTAARLVDAGAWEGDGDTFLIVWDLDDQLTADEVQQQKDAQKVRAKRRRAHLRGDHTTCQSAYCKFAGQSLLRDASRDESRDESRDASRHPNPTRPDPTRPMGEGRGGGSDSGAPADAGAAPPEEDEPTAPPPGDLRAALDARRARLAAAGQEDDEQHRRQEQERLLRESARILVAAEAVEEPAAVGDAG